jgi:hypothetical protein
MSPPSGNSCGRHAATRDEQELLAAKLMGRWRSGAPLVLAPHHDDPDLVADPQRSNNFDYGQMDPRGLACPSARTSGGSTRATRSPTCGGGG